MKIEHTSLLEKAHADVGERHSSEFFELVPHFDEHDDPKLTKQSTTASAQDLLSRFHHTIKSKFGSRIPFSILACILHLPEKLSDWSSPPKRCKCPLILY